MLAQEQQELKEKYYSEAIKYMDDAREHLQNAQKVGSFYRDPKHVKTACGIAYNGLLIALDCFLMLKGIPKPNKKGKNSIEYYQSKITKTDNMLIYLNVAYKILHLSGYYDGIESVKVINEGFYCADKVIEKIKPKAEA